MMDIQCFITLAGYWFECSLRSCKTKTISYNISSESLKAVFQPCFELILQFIISFHHESKIAGCRESSFNGYDCRFYPAQSFPGF